MKTQINSRKSPGPKGGGGGIGKKRPYSVPFRRKKKVGGKSPPGLGEAQRRHQRSAGWRQKKVKQPPKGGGRKNGLREPGKNVDRGEG